MLSDKKVLVTGATGLVVRSATMALAQNNEVWCLARFTDPEVRAELVAQGVKPFTWALGDVDLRPLPDDFTHVLHAAPLRGQQDCNTAAQLDAVSVGGLMHHCRSAESFIFFSTSSVYARPTSPTELISEDAMLGGYAPYAPAYPVGKLAAEGAVRAFAQTYGIPATIARLFVCYGPVSRGGMPVELFGRVLAGEPIWIPLDGAELGTPISTEDVTDFIPALFDVASPSTTIVNLAGDEAVTITEFMTFLAQQAHLPIEIVRDDRARTPNPSDNARRKELLGDCRVHWRDGMRRAVEAVYPGVFDGTGVRPEGKIEADIWGHR